MFGATLKFKGLASPFATPRTLDAGSSEAVRQSVTSAVLHRQAKPLSEGALRGFAVTPLTYSF